jgi:hypothetical protein
VVLISPVTRLSHGESARRGRAYAAVLSNREEAKLNRSHCKISASARTWLATVSAICAVAAAQPCQASTIVDPAGDPIDTYIGAVGPGLDILQFSVTRDATNFFISAVLDGAPGATGSRYNVGVDRGAGAYRFGAGIRPDILVDAAVNLFPATNSGIVTFIGPPDILTPLPSGAVSIEGDTISAIVPISMLPSTGLNPADYKFYFWSRVNITPPTPLYYGIADFAGTGPLRATVPEPETWGLMMFGLGMIGAFMRRRSPKPVAHAVSQTA